MGRFQMKKKSNMLFVLLIIGVLGCAMYVYAIDFKSVDNSGRISNLKEKFDDPLKNK